MDLEKYPEKKSIKCKICQASYQTKQGLKNTICLYIMERNHDASFTQKFDMKKHITSVHDGNKQLKCDMCDARFTWKKTIYM